MDNYNNKRANRKARNRTRLNVNAYSWCRALEKLAACVEMSAEKRAQQAKRRDSVMDWNFAFQQLLGV